MTQDPNHRRPTAEQMIADSQRAEQEPVQNGRVVRTPAQQRAVEDQTPEGRLQSLLDRQAELERDESRDGQGEFDRRPAATPPRSSAAPTRPQGRPAGR